MGLANANVDVSLDFSVLSNVCAVQKALAQKLRSPKAKNAPVDRLRRAALSVASVQEFSVVFTTTALKMRLPR